MWVIMKNNFFCNEKGQPMLLLGLQSHNSSTGSKLIDKAIEAVKAYGGNVLEAPVYWYRLEPREGVYDVTHVRELIRKVRDAGLKLIILWFGANKNGHPTYTPEYIKTNPQKYRLAIGPDGAPVASLSPHCKETLEADKRAFVELMKCIKEEDQEYGTVLAVQVENETGLGNTDRDYSDIAQQDFAKPVPEEIRDIVIEDSGATKGDNTWRGQFGRYAHEAFSAWHHAVYTNEIAAAGKEIYDIPMYVNAMLGDLFAEGGISYNSGGPTVRVLDIWKKGAPVIDLLTPDIYVSSKEEYEYFCRSYKRDDNPLFIPESRFIGMSAALNVIRAVAKYGAIGVCGFGAESYLDENGDLREEAKLVAVSIKAINNIAPLLIKYHGTDRIHAIIQEEFAEKQYIKLPDYHVIAKFQGRRINRNSKDTRGRGILVQTGEHEFYLAGTNIGLDFIKRPEANDDNPFIRLTSRQATQLNFLTVEEGHFENGEWVVDFYRNGDEANYELYVNEGEIVRIRLNPELGI